MKFLKRSLVAFAFVVIGTASSAATLTSLVGGGSISEGGLTFDAFSFTDVGTGFGAPFIGVSSDDILVTASTVGDVVALSFDFAPSISLSTFEAYEIAGSFVATATGATMVSIGILLGGQMLVGDSLVGHNVADAGGLLAEDALGSGFLRRAALSVRQPWQAS